MKVLSQIVFLAQQHLLPKRELQVLEYQLSIAQPTNEDYVHLHGKDNIHHLKRFYLNTG